MKVLFSLKFQWLHIIYKSWVSYEIYVSYARSYTYYIHIYIYKHMYIYLYRKGILSSYTLLKVVVNIASRFCFPFPLHALTVNLQ